MSEWGSPHKMLNIDLEYLNYDDQPRPTREQVKADLQKMLSFDIGDPHIEIIEETERVMGWIAKCYIDVPKNL